MRRIPSAILLMLLFSCFFFYSCPQPTTPEPPKPRATITIEVGSYGADWYWWNSWGYDLYVWSMNFKELDQRLNVYVNFTKIVRLLVSGKKMSL